MHIKHPGKTEKKNRDKGCLISRASKRESGITVAVVGPTLTVSVDSITDRQMQLAACYLMYESVKSHPASICRTESDYKMASDHGVNIRSRLRSSYFPARKFLAYINVYDRKSDSKSLGLKLISSW